jgi:hydroxyacylglutathione hydrolase
VVVFDRYPLRYLNTNMYMLIEKNEALLIDPNVNEKAMANLKNAGVTNLCILLTHEHFDHTNGVNFFRNQIPASVISQRITAETIVDAKHNRPLTLLKVKTEDSTETVLAYYKTFKKESIKVDTVFDAACDFEWHSHKLHLEHHPGHSQGSSVIFFDKNIVFSGDYMIPDTPVILRFPGGSEEAFYNDALPYILSIPDDCQIMPGHGLPYNKSESYYAGDGCFKIKH